MTDTAAAAGTKSIVVERIMPHPPEKIWRALTVAPIVVEWLMETDFEPRVGHRFTFRAKPVPGWSGVVNCQVLKVDEPRCLAFSWGDGTESDSGLQTVLTWTLTPVEGGTHVRMEHSGFRPQDESGFVGMGGGWPRIVARLEQVAGEH
jgi:uncharacterized protein YndB with AHSA1/START domain